jgi:hypothetical protein
VARLRTGQGWDEGTTGDVLREILHVYPASGTDSDLTEANVRVAGKVRKESPLLHRGSARHGRGDER